MSSVNRATHRVASLVCAVFLAGCSTADGEPSPVAGTPGTQYIVGIDISASRTPTQSKEAQQLLGGLIDRMTFGDAIVLVETYQTRSDAAEQWDDTVPALRRLGKISGRERKALEDFRQNAQEISGSFFDSTRTGRVMSTDLLTMLARAADYAKSAGGRRTTLLILSDMLNATPELNMERANGIPEASWIEARKADGRLPDLNGVCVVVAGADVTTARGAKARAFWTEYLAATGARIAESGYRNMVPDVGEISCR